MTAYAQNAPPYGVGPNVGEWKVVGLLVTQVKMLPEAVATCQRHPSVPVPVPVMLNVELLVNDVIESADVLVVELMPEAEEVDEVVVALGEVMEDDDVLVVELSVAVVEPVIVEFEAVIVADMELDVVVKLPLVVVAEGMLVKLVTIVPVPLRVVEVEVKFCG